MPALASVHQCDEALGVCLIRVSLCHEQFAKALLVIVLRREHECGPAVLLGRVNGRPRLEQVESNLLKVKVRGALYQVA